MTNGNNNTKHKAYIKAYEEYLKICRKELIKSKKNLKNRKTPFFVIYEGFKNYLPLLSNNSVKLYLYIGFNIDYRKGFFICDLDKLSAFFQRSLETLNSWLMELQAAQLILVKQEEGKTYIFISPYNTDLKYDQNNTIEKLVDTYKSWINTKKWSNQESHELFYCIPETFMNYWSELRPGSIKVYVYSILSADVMKGFFFKTLDTICHDLAISRRTAVTCFNELKKCNLIDRFQLEFNGCTYTHIIPITHFSEKFL